MTAFIVPTFTGAFDMRLVVGASAMASASLFRAVVQVCILPIIGRILGPHAYGEMALVAPFIFFSMLLAESGLGSCIVRAENVSKELQGTIFCFSIGFSLLAVAIFACIARPLGHLVHEPLFPTLLMGMSSVLVLASFNIVPAAILLRSKRYEMIALSDFVSTLGGVFAVVTGLLLDWGVWTLLGQQLALWICKVTVVTVSSRTRPHLLFRWDIFKKNITFGLNITISSVVSFLSANIDNVLIGSFLGTEQLGYYALAFQIVGLPAAVTSGSAYYTVFSETSDAVRKGTRSQDHFLRVLRGVLLLTIPAMTGIAITSPLSIPLLLGNKWLPSIPLLICLAPLGVAQAMWPPFIGFLIGLGRSDLSLKVVIFVSSFTIAAIGIGIQYSSMAVALGVSAACLFCWIVSFGHCLKAFAPRQHITRTICAPLISSLLMGLTVLLVQKTLFESAPLGLRLLVSIGTGILSYTFFLFGLFRDHIAEDLRIIKLAILSRIRAS